MPKSKKRKKNGKDVKSHDEGAFLKIDPNKESNVTFQDLINVLAYQEYVKDGTIIAEDAVINYADNMPVTIGEGENKREIGTASPIPGDPGAVSIAIHDTEILDQIKVPVEHFSIEKEADE